MHASGTTAMSNTQDRSGDIDTPDDHQVPPFPTECTPQKKRPANQHQLGKNDSQSEDLSESEDEAPVNLKRQPRPQKSTAPQTASNPSSADFPRSPRTLAPHQDRQYQQTIGYVRQSRQFATPLSTAYPALPWSTATATDAIPAASILTDGATTAASSTSVAPNSSQNSPALSRASVKSTHKRNQPDSDAAEPPRAKSRANLKSPERAAKFIYTVEHDAFLANKLSDHRINGILQGTGDRNQLAPPKSKIHQQIAADFNDKFGTVLCRFQIKNKVANMLKLWKETHMSILATGNGDLDKEVLKDRVLRRCSFFYIIEPTWAASWSPAPRTILESPVDLTDENIGGAGADEDDEDETDESRDEEEDSVVATGTESISAAGGGRGTISRKLIKALSQLDELVAGLQDTKTVAELSIKEQEATKRHIADLKHSTEIEEQTTKREIERMRLAKEKEKEIEVEKTKQLAIQLQIEQTKLECLRMEYGLRIG
ncbi:hypothetical protein BG011_006729 [Mortierella polycephala]|uniref:Uncharacterized protein n=1 Tax=Mortierella polycephala TaxID=41804 RepID=A0A9P6PUH5_9FUNG|nr:hypothetical protein BG011_006729 [Mortierella polycephala]